MSSTSTDLLKRTIIALGISTILLFFVALMLLRVAASQKTTLSYLTSGTTPSAQDRRRAVAEDRFILCARSSALTDAEKLADLDKVCDGYATLDEACETQRVPSR